MFSLKANHSANDRGWRRSASSTLLNHLADCPYQTEEVKSAALNDPACSKSLRSGSTGTGRTTRLGGQPGSSPPQFTGPVPHITLPHIPQAGSSTGPATQPTQPTLDWHQTATGFYGQSLPFQGHINPGPSPLPSPLIFSPGLTLAPSDSISQANSQPGSASADSQGSATGGGLNHDRILHPLSSRNSLRSLSRRGTLNINNQYTTWSTEKQQSFENRLGRLTASAGLPFSWVDNPEWLAFVDEFIPAAQSPGRRKLTRTIVPKLVKEIRNQAKKEVHGQNVTIQADGWTGENHHHLIAFMITVRTKVSSRLKFNFFLLHIF